MGSVFFITEEKVPAIPEDIHVVSVLPASKASLKIPGTRMIFSSSLSMMIALNPLGLISVDAPLDNQRPDQMTLNALEVFAVQASTHDGEPAAQPGGWSTRSWIWNMNGPAWKMPQPVEPQSAPDAA